MTGERVKTTPTLDGFLDVYATRDVMGLPENVEVKIRTLAFVVVDEDKFKRVDGPENLEETSRVVENASLRLKIEHKDTTTAYAFEVTLPME
jgi:hypothetical protein